MLVKVNGLFEQVGKEVLTEFLKARTDRGGRVTERVELSRFVPISCCAAPEEAGEADAGVFRWVFSSFDLDRVFERVDCGGWDIGNFEKNPVVLWAHDHRVPAIGYAENLCTGEELSGDIRFNGKEFDEFGWGIGQRVLYGSIRAGSVGFLVKEVEFVDHKKNPDEKADIIYRRQELLEFSICNVPANPAALYGGKAAANGAEKSEYDFFNQFAGIVRQEV